jgi:hypothetical protein
MLHLSPAARKELQATTRPPPRPCRAVRTPGSSGAIAGASRTPTLLPPITAESSARAPIVRQAAVRSDPLETPALAAEGGPQPETPGDDFCVFVSAGSLQRCCSAVSKSELAGLSYSELGGLSMPNWSSWCCVGEGRPAGPFVAVTDSVTSASWRGTISWSTRTHHRRRHRSQAETASARAVC